MDNTSIEFVQRVLGTIFRNSYVKKFNSTYSSFIDNIVNVRLLEDPDNLELVRSITIHPVDEECTLSSQLVSSYKFLSPGEEKFVKVPYRKLPIELIVMREIKDYILETIEDYGTDHLTDELSSSIKDFQYIGPGSLSKLTEVLYDSVLPGYMLKLNRDVKTLQLIMNDYDKETLKGLLDVLVLNNRSYPDSLFNTLIEEYSRGGFLTYVAGKKDLVEDLIYNKFKPQVASNLWTLLSYRLLAEFEFLLDSKFMENK